jgi:hypothetical protein
MVVVVVIAVVVIVVVTALPAALVPGASIAVVVPMTRLPTLISSFGLPASLDRHVPSVSPFVRRSRQSLDALEAEVAKFVLRPGRGGLPVVTDVTSTSIQTSWRLVRAW